MVETDQNSNLLMQMHLGRRTKVRIGRFGPVPVMKQRRRSSEAPSFLRLLRFFAAKPGPARFPIRKGVCAADGTDGAHDSGDMFQEPADVEFSRWLKWAALSRRLSQNSSWIESLGKPTSTTDEDITQFLTAPLFSSPRNRVFHFPIPLDMFRIGFGVC